MTKREKFKLRKLEEKDLEPILKWRNSDRVRANMFSDHIISWEEHLEWFKKIQEKNNVSYCVCELGKLPIGVVYFTEIDWDDQTSLWGFYVGELQFPLPLGAYIEFLALEYAFETLMFRKLSCEVFNFNQEAIKLHKQFGFQQEGYFVEQVRKNNQYLDVLFFSLFKEDWIIHKNKIAKLVFRSKKSTT